MNESQHGDDSSGRNVCFCVHIEDEGHYCVCNINTIEACFKIMFRRAWFLNESGMKSLQEDEWIVIESHYCASKISAFDLLHVVFLLVDIQKLLDLTQLIHMSVSGEDMVRGRSLHLS